LVKGIGTVKCKIGDHVLCLENVQYIPDLSESIYSLFLHIRSPGHGLHSTFDDGLFILFPTFRTKAILGTDDIYLDAAPFHLPSDQVDCNSSIGGDFDDNTSIFCRNVKRFQTEVEQESKNLDNIMKHLRRYYKEIKTNRQLNLEVPAGFRQSSTLQQDYHPFLLPQKSFFTTNDKVSITPNDTSQESYDTQYIFTSNEKDTTSENNTNSSSTNLSSTPINIPIVRSIDKPSSSLPLKISMSEDYLRASVGFRRIDTLKQQFEKLYLGSVKIDSMPADAILDSGDLATLRKKDRNTTPVPRPSSFGEVIHMDIVFGPEISIGNIHYGLLFADRFSRMSYIYPLQNLTTDIKKQMESFFAHIGFIPKRLISDFDLKLIGGKAREYLNSLLIHVNAAPSHRQDKNGLVERHWQTMVSMARNWLASAELPSTFWFYAVCRAAEVCNYFPFKLEDGSYTTPFELAHN
jgi:hypothetical protein